MIYPSNCWQLVNATLDYARHWLHDWGDLLLTAVIAWAAIMQWVVSKRLFGLTKAVEDFKNRPLLFCRIGGNAFDGLTYTAIIAQLSNLSSFGIWMEEAVLVFDGQFDCEPSRTFKIESVLGAGETYSREILEMPFADVVRIGSPRTTVKIQIRFYYSTSHTTGVRTSPFYSMTIDNTVASITKVSDIPTESKS